MWIRGDLKARAKDVLRTNYWKAFLISLVIALAGGSNGGSSGGGGSQSARNSGSGQLPFFIDANFYQILIAAVFAVTLGITAIFLLRIFLGYPLEVGGRRYFIQSAQYSDNSRCFSYAFYGETYLRIVGTMFIRGILTFLWFLLFIIPGIVKSYAYSMVPYILADDPQIGYMDAIRLSNRMTEGHKFDMFVLDLSFIGWYLLGSLALGVGVLFVMPYENATKAELYLVLRDNYGLNGSRGPQWDYNR